MARRTLGYIGEGVIDWSSIILVESVKSGTDAESVERRGATKMLFTLWRWYNKVGQKGYFGGNRKFHSKEKLRALL